MLLFMAIKLEKEGTACAEVRGSFAEWLNGIFYIMAKAVHAVAYHITVYI